MDPDDLTELERRLSGWRPATGGLDADAMLFAAGRAAAPRRLLWPALTGLLAVLSLGLGYWATAERAERLALARQLRQAAPPPPAPLPSPVESPEPATPAESWLSAHRALEYGVEAWVLAPRPNRRVWVGPNPSSQSGGATPSSTPESSLPPEGVRT